MKTGQTLPDAFETSPRLVSLYAQPHGDGETTGWHSHERGQLLAAARGLMVATTAVGAWYVPADHALWIPPGVAHDVAMRGPVWMTSAYVAPPAALGLPHGCKVLAVSPLLRAAIAALAGEPPLYDEAGRGGHLAALIVDEIGRAADAALALPMPSDRRLVRLCHALMAAPQMRRGLDALAEAAGMSRRSLTRHFRAETGLSVLAWRRRARVLAALGPPRRALTPGLPPPPG
ncbi:AraC family transcriptional regulator [Labrys wisconsinensis]|uniref:AcrR family transcriptional regulator n=1 Tax=Labrys wisconsinensis TaxID=425677 RepID=A0ABU0JE60_9HYPH|nr:helix-turn-helix transcriptional regulator [Labrys wisconsinensis]MDQ0472553.1 AcrR family transcriptional regulator [Labrys wisconsinensis]